MYADDSTGIFTSDSSMQHSFYWIDLFGRVSGSKINFHKSKGMFLGKWKTRSDHPFGISWIKYHKILGCIFGFDFSDDDVWYKWFLKFDQTLNLWKNRKLSFKGKFTVLNSSCLSKLLYYSTLTMCLLIIRYYFKDQCLDLFGTQNSSLYLGKHCFWIFKMAVWKFLIWN